MTGDDSRWSGPFYERCLVSIEFHDRVGCAGAPTLKAARVWAEFGWTHPARPAVGRNQWNRMMMRKACGLTAYGSDNFHVAKQPLDPDLLGWA